MDPIAPLSKVGEWGPNALIIAAGLLGVGFGFVLERAGFGNARTLAGQWYGYNFAVLRVMFTAIVVAMVGLFGLWYLGVVDLSAVYVNDTFLWPQIVGGVIFGIGFGVGQYCPGTAVVACATGKIDAITFMGGFFVGLIAFFFSYDTIAPFYASSSMGRVMLHEWLGVPAGVVVLAVVVVALGAFGLTHVIDRRFALKRGTS
ncbi:MAG: YeeE/YedE family protein [Archangiaceae bacterium]|nr:YeeE/YedE family protein [Archangiaceae bacterium]